MDIGNDVTAATCCHIKLVMATFVGAYVNSGCSYTTTSWQCLGKHQKIAPGFIQSQKNSRTVRILKKDAGDVSHRNNII